MAGIGVKLTNIYKKNTLTTDIIGVGYSTVVTIAPMLVVIGALVLMEYFLDFSSVAYITRELFSCTVLYIFIFCVGNYILCSRGDRGKGRYHLCFYRILRIYSTCPGVLFHAVSVYL